ncbi:hydroxysqualene dehydroxylase [Nocardia wallacei]|uniref:hydroxysqualene dehydroxylase n=1 Tax=Nocardia wallacei TaxID=480035 RepID=UPI002454D91F|nr:FAD-dependent oxidoreductase [Nocardia wallacei]
MNDANDHRIARRTVLRGAATVGGGVLLSAAGGNPLRATPPTPSSGRRVAVFGAGIAGLTTATELVERGFEVTVFEATSEFGGKARSFSIPDTATGGRNPLPGEHGFRIFQGFLQHVPDTMRRIPVPGNPNGVWDNLVGTSAVRLCRPDAEDAVIPLPYLHDEYRLIDPATLGHTLATLLGIGTAAPVELMSLVQRLWVFATSSDERRFGQWEYTTWREFVRADGKPQVYQQLASHFPPQFFASVRETEGSSRTIARWMLAFIYNILGRANDGPPTRVLNAPTNEAWFDHWVSYLRSRGVEFVLGHAVEAFEVSGDRIGGARVRGANGRSRVEADWYVCALPGNRARELWSPQILALDPGLERMNGLSFSWMVGGQLFLRRRRRTVPGHAGYIYAPWALASVDQAQFWPGRDFPRDYGDGQVQDCLSIDIMDWHTPGVLYGKPATHCSPEEIGNEVIAQINMHLNDRGVDGINESDVHSWHLDPAIEWDGQENTNATPMLSNSVGAWDSRPEARTAIPNFVLAGDYVHTDIDARCMEGANEGARHAVNALLELSGSPAAPVPTWTMYTPPELEPLRRADLDRYRRGLPNQFDLLP